MPPPERRIGPGLGSQDRSVSTAGAQYEDNAPRPTANIGKVYGGKPEGYLERLADWLHASGWRIHDNQAWSCSGHYDHPVVLVAPDGAPVLLSQEYGLGTEYPIAPYGCGTRARLIPAGRGWRLIADAARRAAS